MLVGFSGLRGSGKDSAAAVLVEEYGYTRVALADAVRDLTAAINPYIFLNESEDGAQRLLRLDEVLRIWGWDRAKREIPEVRRLMQAVGTEGGRNLFGENFWINVLKGRTPDLFAPETKYVITDCRFTNEGEFVQSGGGTLIWIDRPGINPDGHASETTELRTIANYIITNDSDILEFKEDVRFSLFMLGVF